MYIKVINKRMIYTVVVSIVILFAVGVLVNARQVNTVLTSGEVETLSNKKIGWGIKRAQDHVQPDLGSENVSLMKEYNGMFLGNKDKKYVYLTFDNGYEAGYTDQILNILKENEVTATFFITGHYLNSQEELVKKMIDNGNIVRKSHHKSLLNARYSR